MIEFTFQELVRKLKDKEPFTFTRFGDGEMTAIWNDGIHKANCDDHVYFDDLGVALSDVLKSNPEYFIGLQGLVKRQSADRIDKYFTENDIAIDFCEADILHKASIKGHVWELFEALHNSDNVILVGADYLEKINEYFEFDCRVGVPEENCWLERDTITKGIDYAIRKIRHYNASQIVVVLVASMAANVIADDLHGKYDNVTIIDAGSIFDPFVNKKSRSYHRNMDILKINGYG